MKKNILFVILITLNFIGCVSISKQELISNKDYYEKYLNDFLSQNSISQICSNYDYNSFNINKVDKIIYNKYLNFLNDNNLFCLSKFDSLNGKLIVDMCTYSNMTSKYGYFYLKNQNDIASLPWENFSRIEKIDDHWFYYSN